VNKQRPFGMGRALAGEAVASVNVPQGQGCEGSSCEQATVPPMSLPSQVVVYYFRGNARCPSCYKLEQYAKEAVEQNFADELKDGRMLFKVVNIDQAANSHFVNDYQLYTKSVVISLVKEGKQVKFKNLDKVWVLLRDQNSYHNYVRDEVKSFLGEL
jgi:thiol-disulfide isomerase/thioredoxin